MKSLYELSLWRIGCCLDTIPRAGAFLAASHKEQLLEWLTSHDRLLSPAFLAHVTYNLFSASLKRVRLVRCDAITDGVLRQLAASGCRLRELTIHACRNVTDEGVAEVTLGQSELQVVELRKLTKLTGAGLVNISSPALSKLDLRGCSAITSQDLASLLSRNRHIRHLCVVMCTKLDDSACSAIAQILQGHLEELDLADLHIVSDASAIALAYHCPNLRSINFQGWNKMTEGGLSQVLSHCQGLRHLDLSYCSRLQKSPASRVFLVLPTSLVRLSLCGVLLSDVSLLVAAVTRLTSLREVVFSGVPALNDLSIEQILSVIGCRLECLDVGGCVMSPLSDAGLRSVSRHCASLRLLGLARLSRVTGTPILNLLRGTQTALNFTCLMLGSRQMDENVLHCVATRCHNLQRLDLSGLRCIDDTLLTELANNCPSLQHLNVKGCRLVTDEGVCAVARSCPLLSIVLSGLPLLTDTSIFALANSCPHLEEIFLNGCGGVTRSAVLYLVDCCIPRLHFIHQIPNQSSDQLMARNLDTGHFCRADLMNISTSS